MTKRILLLLFLTVAVMAAAIAQTPVRNFIPVQGAGFKERLDAAMRDGGAQAQKQGHYWTAYSFDVRPGVVVDLQIVSDDGSTFNLEGSSIVVGNSPVETRNLGVFLLRSVQGGTIERVNVLNLEREHDFAGYPVFWLGHVSNDESLAFLRPLASTTDNSGVGSPATLAISIHDDQRVFGALVELAQSARSKPVRIRAIAALGRSGASPEAVAFLSGIVRNSAAEMEIREQAVRSLGKLRDPAGLNPLIQSFEGSADQRFRRRIISAVGMNNDRKGAIKFLLDVAANGGDVESKRNAMLQLSQLAAGPNRRDQVGLDVETDVQREAILAISRRPKDEAVPILINIARTHMKEDIRRQAFISLGRIGDDRALEFFREQLSR
jgi:hypothetical protein